MRGKCFSACLPLSLFVNIHLSIGNKLVFHKPSVLPIMSTDA